MKSSELKARTFEAGIAKLHGYDRESYANGAWLIMHDMLDDINENSNYETAEDKLLTLALYVVNTLETCKGFSELENH